MFIDLNCDMAEGFANDAQLMPFLSSANIACGYHAGSGELMEQTVELALENNVAIGAHPGFADKANFGRTEIQLSPEEIYDLVTAQVWLLKKTTARFDTKLQHVKPHGALYNMSAKDPALAETIAKAVYAVDPSLLLFGLSGSHSISEAKKAGLQTVSEVFADRTYQDNGSLTPRTQNNAMIETGDASIEQVLQMIGTKTVTSVSGKIIPITAETICLHGDGIHAVTFAEKIAHTLKQNGIGIKSF